ncbi:MAG: alpha/beta hydrolase [Oligoflexales bacterium]|nr:alpha/beta hydrolase [Oligoflexales bacterium]
MEIAAGFAVFATIFFLIFTPPGRHSLIYRPTFKDAQGHGDDLIAAWRNETGEFLGYARKGDVRHDSRRTILVFHGNAGEARDWKWYARVAAPEHRVLLAEYPGYGARKGKSSESSLCTAGLDAYDRAAAMGGPVMLVGESLGSAVASCVASQRSPDRIIFVSPYTSLSDVVDAAIPLLSLGVLMDDRYNSENWLRDVKAPLLVAHGDRDRIVPIRLGRKLFEGYRGKSKVFLELKDQGHDGLREALSTGESGSIFLRFLNGDGFSISENN